ncbi:BLUF domain-containing protein [Hymenobacter latericus]|uniref:BLUF domain-containing protein n=1 Tax=Hymenobacter sp. YIM 151858-1 TaxID=2987688 RepID=UPI00222722B9|nr:BLUF domain-containing protein [Hymenobacter sp. YIM 151858-1]UYZ60740.1 BLUF domain-containing protein [Hymenobacter sp. YIM 151858-1]
MHHIVYQSTAVQPLSAEALHVMLEKSRRKNRGLGITGLLLYSYGNILQILEGEEPAVQGLYETIRQDVRHTNVLTLADGPIEHRMFSDWTMGFQDLPDHDFQQVMSGVEARQKQLPAPTRARIDEPLLCLIKSFVEDEQPRL